MNIETIRANLESELNKHVGVIQVKALDINSQELRDRYLANATLAGFEFITHQDERFYTFAIETDLGIRFTRCKEGVFKYLLSDLREKDFYFTMSGNIHSRYDVIGKFVETVINSWGRETINAFIDNQCLNFGTHNCVSGFKITRQHKDTLTFDGISEVMIPQNDGYKTFTLKFINGRFDSAYDGNTPVSIRQVFSK